MSQENHAAHAGDLLVGTNYQGKRLIGRGNMGLVLEAEHVALNVTVVVKLLHKELATRADFVERMRLEAQALARLRSPHLVAVTDFSVTPSGQPFLVMERLLGGTLGEELGARGALPVDEAIDIARQTLAGLEVAHAAGIIHRDIKPANVFLCRGEGPGGRRLVKILDFGIAKVLASGSNGSAPRPLRFPTAEGDVVGTPRCLSPEQARALPVDARTDVYAVGLMLYALVTGAGPFDDVRGAINVLQAHVAVIPPPPSTRASKPIPAELDRAIMRALAKNPDDRFPSAALFSAALAHITARAPAAVRIPAPRTAARFDTELVSPAARRTPASPVYAANCAPSAPAAWSMPAHAITASSSAAAPLEETEPGRWLASGRSAEAARRATSQAVLLVVLGMLAFAFVILAVLAVRGWMLH